MTGRHKTIEVFNAAAITADPTPVDRHNSEGQRGICAVIDITAGTTLSLTLRIQHLDPISGKYVNILSSAALTGVGTTRLIVYPGCVAAANAVANEPLPELYRIVVNHGNANAATYKVSACLIP
jgi:hypothetical protein